MKYLSLIGLSLGILTHGVEAQSNFSPCTLRVATAAFRGATGAGIEKSYAGHNLRRGDIVTDLMSDSRDSAGNIVFTSAVRDGTGKMQGALSTGRVHINPATNKIVAINNDRGQFHGNYFDQTSMQIVAADVALWLMNLNRPDMGSRTSVPSVTYAGTTVHEGRNIHWYNVNINGSQGQSSVIQVALDPMNAAPLVSVKMGNPWWQTDQGLSALASSAARFVGDASMQRGGLTLGNQVTDMAGTNYYHNEHRGILYRGVNSGGNALADFTVRYADPSRALLQGVWMQPRNNGAVSPHPEAAIREFMEDAVLGLHNLVRVDANEQTYFQGYRAISSGWEGNVQVTYYQVTIGDRASPQQFFNYRVGFAQGRAFPVLLVERL